MKKILTILFATTLFISVLAQDSKLEITPSAGYLFSAKSSWGYAEMNLEDNYSANLAVSVRFHESALIEVMYHTASSNLNSTVYNGIYGRQFYYTPVTLNTYHLGIVREFNNEKVRPFTNVSLGLTQFHPTDKTEGSSENGINPAETVNNSDIWSFSASFGAGAKINLSQRIGLRLQGRLMLPMYFSGLGIYCGSGCGGGATFGVYFLQMDLSGGIVIGLGEY